MTSRNRSKPSRIFSENASQWTYRPLATHREEAGADLDGTALVLGKKDRPFADDNLLAEPLWTKEHDHLAHVALVPFWVCVF